MVVYAGEAYTQGKPKEKGKARAARITESKTRRKGWQPREPQVVHAAPRAPVSVAERAPVGGQGREGRGWGRHKPFCLIPFKPLWEVWESNAVLLSRSRAARKSGGKGWGENKHKKGEHARAKREAMR